MRDDALTAALEAALLRQLFATWRSINDGYFVNNPAQNTWQDIPASYHNGACGFSFADGHAELHIEPDGNFGPWEQQHLPQTAQ